MQKKIFLCGLALCSALLVLTAGGVSQGSIRNGSAKKEVREIAWQGRNHEQAFAVDFTNCLESIGVTLVPTERARAYVPAPFILAGEGQPVTPLVVRTARCAAAVDGDKPGAAEIVQIGAVIVPPDGTGDINNYTFWYYTSDPKLATQLRKAGVSVQHTPTIDYDFDQDDNSFMVRVPRPGAPRFVLSGTVQPSPTPAGSFLANWWQQTENGVVKMSTSVPVINIGGADLTLTTDPSSPLGQLIGGGVTGFPIIQQFNTFATAHMDVSMN
jgi:hypothetical protein